MQTESRVFTVIGIDTVKIIYALENDDFNDLEDCFQYECAKEFMADYIITRNVKDFFNGSIEAVEPRTFLKSYDDI